MPGPDPIAGDETVVTRVFDSTPDSPVDTGAETVAVQVFDSKTGQEAGLEPGAEADHEAEASADTAAVPVSSSSPPSPPPEDSDLGTPRRSNLWRWLIPLCVLALLAIGAVSAYGGYVSGIDQRTRSEGTQVAMKVSEQFELGMQDFEARRFDLARQRFEYVIQLEPDYPGVTEMLAQVLLEINTTATPTSVPTPTLTPTPDLRNAEQLFSEAQLALADSQWNQAIEALLKLRKDEAGFQPVKVDSMLFVALRNRGVDRILKDGDLEGGTYDLALAERFGPLDVEANNYRLWADLYVTGASFWGLDWAQSAYYFGQVAQFAPSLRDNTNFTAGERFRMATLKYGDQLAANEQWCDAYEQYNIAFSFGADPSVEPTATWVGNKCEGGDDNGNDNNGGGEPTPEVTEPPGPTEPPPPQETPTPEPTQPGYPAP
jgi:hypothetical protein